MSIKLMTQVWDEAPYESAQLLVLLALADHAGDDGRCFPSMSRIAKRARCSVRWARATIAEFEQDGVVTREFRQGSSTVYCINPTPELSSPRKRSSGG